jgi:hypothetical protein
MRLTFRRAMVATALFVVSAGISVAGASTKFSYTEEVTQTGSAVVRFEEGSLKRFDVLDYRLDATAVAVWVSPCGGQAIEGSSPNATGSLIPDANGRVSGTLTLDPGLPPPIPCPVLQHVEYTSVTLTNQSTGHVYRLDSISRDFPT